MEQQSNGLELHVQKGKKGIVSIYMSNSNDCMGLFIS